MSGCHNEELRNQVTEHNVNSTACSFVQQCINTLGFCQGLYTFLQCYLAHEVLKFNIKGEGNTRS